MRLQLAYVTLRSERLKSDSAQTLVQEYVQRCGRYATVEARPFRSEESLLSAVARRTGRMPAYLVLLDSRGRTLTSIQFAEVLKQQRDASTQEMVLAIGPADGWSAAAREQAKLLLSLSAMTFPHELALVLLAEQLYRALTILAGHPYHSGHA